MKAIAKWKKTEDTNYRHTAVTMYETDGFRVWKGKYRVFDTIYSANEWHLERLSDHRILHSGRTAKECMGVLEYSIRHGEDIEGDILSFCLWSGIRFDENFNIIS